MTSSTPPARTYQITIITTAVVRDAAMPSQPAVPDRDQLISVTSAATGSVPGGC